MPVGSNPFDFYIGCDERKAVLREFRELTRIGERLLELAKIRGIRVKFFPWWVLTEKVCLFGREKVLYWEHGAQHCLF
jgi:hypothetical protein